jgi:Uma2 family endonuclease
MTVLLEGKKVRIPKPKLLTYDDYAKLTPPDSGNYELHNGKIITMPTPTPLHQRISRKLSTRLDIFIEKNKCGEMFTAPMDTVFTVYDTLQPDILYIQKERLNIIGAKKIEGVPDLVIEISSPGNSQKELSYKKYVYETSGVREYWLIHPEKQQIAQYENIDNELVRLGVWGLEDAFDSKVLIDFKINVKEIFE